MTTRVDLLQALQAGRAAGVKHAPLKTCPYPADDLRRAAWVRGHVQGRRGAASPGGSS